MSVSPKSVAIPNDELVCGFICGIPQPEAKQAVRRVDNNRRGSHGLPAFSAALSSKQGCVTS